MRKGARVGGGKVKVNENGEVYIERRGRKPGSGKIKTQTRITPSTSFCPQSSSVGIARRRSSARNASRKGESRLPNVHLSSLMRKYGSRRSLLFKSVRPLRSPATRAILITRDAIWHANTLFQVGDIVAVTDEENGLPYFAQIRGLITDPLVRHHAALTWLIPKQSADDPHYFEPEHFAHGVVDRKNYPLEHCRWLCSRPLLASYQREWTPRAAAAARLRQEMCERLAHLWKTATEEIIKEGYSPIVSLVDRRNAEPK